MSRGMLLIFIIVALVSGYIATNAMKNYMKNQAGGNGFGEGFTPVVVAKFQIPAASKILDEQLEICQFPKTAAPIKCYSKKEDLVGRVVNTNIFQGEILVPERVEKEGAQSGLSAIVPKGLRAITLKVDDTSGLAGLVRPGNFVDIMTTLRTPNQGDDSISKVILQNVKVIATGQVTISNEKNEKVGVVPTVTVLTTLEQAERLSLASTEGKVRLVLRNFEDQAEIQTEGVRLSSLIPQSEGDLAPPKEVFATVEPSVVSPAPTPTPIPPPTPKPTPRERKVTLYSGSEKQEFIFEY